MSYTTTIVHSPIPLLNTQDFINLLQLKLSCNLTHGRGPPSLGRHHIVINGIQHWFWNSITLKVLYCMIISFLNGKVIRLISIFVEQFRWPIPLSVVWTSLWTCLWNDECQDLLDFSRRWYATYMRFIFIIWISPNDLSSKGFSWDNGTNGKSKHVSILLIKISVLECKHPSPLPFAWESSPISNNLWKNSIECCKIWLLLPTIWIPQVSTACWLLTKHWNNSLSHCLVICDHFPEFVVKLVVKCDVEKKASSTFCIDLARLPFNFLMQIWF